MNGAGEVGRRAGKVGQGLATGGRGATDCRGQGVLPRGPRCCAVGAAEGGIPTRLQCSGLEGPEPEPNQVPQGM